MTDPELEATFLARIVDGNTEARSWREKLAMVDELLNQSSETITNGELTLLATYLRFLNSGEVSCEEDGRHFRPSHHARIATQIHARLAALEDRENAFVIRKFQACLPSTAAPFQRPEPLTRIRDIAHRNDIPHDLKREIKTTLQNKLHRCAGPEDLVTSANILQRITAPDSNYSHDFVAQFQIFHGELSEFFNASSLNDRLNGLAGSTDANIAEQISHFLGSKLSDSANARHQTLTLLTQLREMLSTHKEGDPIEHRLADIALEDYAFTLLSEILNDFEADPLTPWEPVLDVLVLALRQLELGNVQKEEAQVVDWEVSAWQQDFDATDTEMLLRLKASTERAQRLVDEFGDEVLEEFANRAELLGNRLGVCEHATRVFAEAEIRNHVAFQLAKLTSLILYWIRHALELPPWDVLVRGSTNGRLTQISVLSEYQNNDEPQIILLEEAAGDEEIPRGVVGILVAHELPHLSHLAVRARQAGVVVASCEEIQLFRELKQRAGEWVTLHATPDGIEIVESTPSTMQTTSSPSDAMEIPEVDLSPALPIIPLEQCDTLNGGNKSDGARRLLEIAALPEAGFTAPSGLVIPFGVMEQALGTEGRRTYKRKVKGINELTAEQFAATTRELQELILDTQVPEEIYEAVITTFGPDVKLAVRSSANSEDLPDMAGAGLHESITGVCADEVADAISDVWASLWTERAAFSRRQANIPHLAAHMAILIQPLVEPDLSFILHTVNPLTGQSDECYVELAMGLGETLASATSRGTPYRLCASRLCQDHCMISFANFSYALEVDSSGYPIARQIDYSQVPFSTDSELRTKIANQLATVASRVEGAFGVAQDIEGVIQNGEIVLVQSRTQQGL